MRREERKGVFVRGLVIGEWIAFGGDSLYICLDRKYIASKCMYDAFTYEQSKEKS